MKLETKNEKPKLGSREYLNHVINYMLKCLDNISERSEENRYDCEKIYMGIQIICNEYMKPNGKGANVMREWLNSKNF